jgi:hypothetical protein
MQFTLDEYAASSQEKDPVKLLRDYRGAVQVRLLGDDQSNGQFDEVMADVDSQLLQHAKDSGIDLKDFGPSQEDDTRIVARHSLDTNEPELGEAANRYRALRDPSIKESYKDNPDEYLAKLEAARIEYEAVATPEKREAAKRGALNRGDIPFTTFSNPDGTKRLELGSEILKVAGDDAALAKLFEADSSLDRSYLPEVRKKLQTPDGFTAPLAKIERQQDAFAGIEAFVKASPMDSGKVDALREAISSGRIDNIDPLLEQINTAMSGTPLAEQFDEEERKVFLKDYITQQSQAKLDPDAPESGLRTLSTGQVHVPTSLMMNKATFDKVLPKLPEGQQAMAADHREKVVAAYAKDAFKTIIARRGDEFTDHYADQKAAGKTDTQILDEWTADPKNQSTAYEYVSGIAESIPSATIGTAAGLIAWKTGSKTAAGVVQYFDKENRQRKEFANILGKDLGVGYDIGTMVAPVVVDIFVTKGAAAAVRATAGAAARAAIKPVVRARRDQGPPQLVRQGQRQPRNCPRRTRRSPRRSHLAQAHPSPQRHRPRHRSGTRPR